MRRRAGRVTAPATTPPPPRDLQAPPRARRHDPRARCPALRPRARAVDALVHLPRSPKARSPRRWLHRASRSRTCTTVRTRRAASAPRSPRPWRSSRRDPARRVAAARRAGARGREPAKRSPSRSRAAPRSCARKGSCSAHVADEGIMESCAGDLLRYRRAMNADHVRVLVDIKQKYLRTRSPLDVRFAVRPRRRRVLLADGVIVTGNRHRRAPRRRPTWTKSAAVAAAGVRRLGPRA